MHMCVRVYAYQSMYPIIDTETGIWRMVDMYPHTGRLHSVFMSVVIVLNVRIVKTNVLLRQSRMKRSRKQNSDGCNEYTILLRLLCNRPAIRLSIVIA